MEQSEIESKNNKESKVWLGEDGIIHIEMGGIINEKTLELLKENFLEVAKKLSTKPKVLAVLGPVPHVPSSLFRRKTLEVVKEVLKNPGFEKIAICGGGAMQRISALFIITASGLKNIKHFDTEEEALKWLKEE